MALDITNASIVGNHNDQHTQQQQQQKHIFAKINKLDPSQLPPPAEDTKTVDTHNVALFSVKSPPEPESSSIPQSFDPYGDSTRAKLEKTSPQPSASLPLLPPPPPSTSGTRLG